MSDPILRCYTYSEEPKNNCVNYRRPFEKYSKTTGETYR